MLLAESYFNVKNAICVSSGTAGIKTALKAAGVKNGDEVITQGFNFIATIEAILDCGAVPVIVPIDQNLNMDFDATKALITKKTKAIIIVHMLASRDTIKFKSICETYSIALIEDNYEAIGSKLNTIVELWAI